LVFENPDYCGVVYRGRSRIWGKKGRWALLGQFQIFFKLKKCHGQFQIFFANKEGAACPLDPRPGEEMDNIMYR
jgi:hypothetical protein